MSGRPATHPLADQIGLVLADLNAGELGRAIARCASLCDRAPDDPAVLQLHATVALRDGRAIDALASVTRSLELRPGHLPSLLLAGRAARAAGLPARATQPLRDAVARAPNAAEPAFLLCLTLLDLRHSDLDAALAALSRFPAAAVEWLGLGAALQREGQPIAALEAYAHAAAADPARAAPHIGRGLLLRGAGDLAGARLALSRAVELDPAAAAAWFALGLTCQDLRDEAAAAVAFEGALVARPDMAEAAVNLGIARQAMCDMAAAMDAWLRAVRIRPDTLSRVAHAMTTGSSGMLYLDVVDLRFRLGV